MLSRAAFDRRAPGPCSKRLWPARARAAIARAMDPDRPPPDAPFVRAWASRRPGQLIGKGHPAGDFLEAYDWQVLEEAPGRLRIRAHLPEHVRNPRGQLFGGFTPTYVDLVALFRVDQRSVEQRLSPRSAQDAVEPRSVRTSRNPRDQPHPKVVFERE